MCFFLVSNLGELDTIFAFNMAFAALAAGIATRFGVSVWAALLTIAVAAAAMSVRVIWIEGVRPDTLLFAGAATGGILLLAGAGWLVNRGLLPRPWMTLGGLSMATGLAALPLSPA
jgi:hypothetical protein